MSQSLTLELSEQVFAAIQRQAQAIGYFWANITAKPVDGNLEDCRSELLSIVINS